MKPDFEPTTQARYQSQRELGRGEDTRVELVYDQKRQLNLARKTWEHASAELRFRLRQQHRRSLNISHPNIVRVYDLIADNEDTALTMELIHGVEAHEYAARVASHGASALQNLAGTIFLLRQLSAALVALHKADVVHRGIKPRNWLVEETGRAVLLDAGFSFASDRVAAADHGASWAHASPYLAPECLRGALHSVESDCYSLGVFAFELLTGQRPFKGSLESVLRAKDGPIDSLREACPVVPDDLDDLVLALLSRDPRARPAHDEITSLLDSLTTEYPFDPQVYADPPPSKPSHVQLKATPISTAEPGPAVQNVAESAAMVAQNTESPLAVSDVVPAPALRHLSPTLLEEPPTLLVGDVADELAELVDDVLSTLPQAPQSNTQQPTAAAAPLAAASEETLPVPAAQGPFELALGQILEQLARERDPELLCVRGAAGTGKTSLLAALTKQLADQAGYFAMSRGGGAQPLAALHELVQQIAQALGDDLSSTLQFIEPAQRSALVRLCPALVGAADSHIDVSAANPQRRVIDAHLGLRALFMQVCARKRVVLMIDDAHALDADTLAALRALLSVPVLPKLHVVFTSDSAATTAEAIAALLDGLSDARPAARTLELDPVQTRHSRPPERPLETPELSQDPETLVAQAQKASEALALQRAADLLDRAVRLSDAAATPELLQQAAIAHSVAGRLRDAARLWLALARTSSDPSQAQHFELEAGTCFLRANDEEHGLSIMRGVLRNVGLHWPRTPLLTSTVERARALLRQSRPPSAAKPAETSGGHPQRFAALWGVAKELVLVAPDVSDALCARALREAQANGSRSQLLWALGYEATSAANIGGVFMQRRAATLASQVRELADASASAYDLAFASSVEAVVAWFQGDWPEAEQRLRGALQAYSCVDANTSQERHVLSNFLIGALEAQGRLFALRDFVTELRLSALQSGHRQALAFCELSAAGVLDLAQDRPLQAIDRADAVLCAYAANSGFTPLHFQHFVVTANARLYAGHHAQAYQQVEQAWQQLRRTHLAQLEGVATMVHQLRARAALALAAHSVDHEAARLRAQAHKLANTLGRSNLPHVLALRHVIDANAAALAHHRSSAEAHCLRASELFDVADMPLYREAARMARSAAGEGIEARLDAAQSFALLAQAGVQNPACFAAAWFPALRNQLLEVAATH